MPTTMPRSNGEKVGTARGEAARRLRLGAGFGLAAALAAGGCGDNQTAVLFQVSGVPARTSHLTVQAQLDGKPAQSSVELTLPVDQFALTLPAAVTGHVTMSFLATDSDGCTQGTGKGETDVPMRQFDSPIAVPIAAQSPRKCGTLPPCALGTVCGTTKPQTSTLSNLWATSPTDVWGVGNSGAIVHYDGTAWKSVASGTTQDLLAVWASAANNVWVVGALGTILHYTGSSFSGVGNGAVYGLNGIWGLGANDIWAVGDDSAVSPGPGEFWHWDGSSWKKVSTGITGRLFGVWASADTDIFASGELGLMLHWNGSSWIKMATAVPTSDLVAVWGTGAQQVFSVGSGGTIIRYDGASWRKLSIGTSSDINAIFGDGTTIYAVGASGTFLHSSAPFDSFLSYSSGVTNDLYGLQPTASGIGWVAGKSGYLASFDTRP